MYTASLLIKVAKEKIKDNALRERTIEFIRNPEVSVKVEKGGYIPLQRAPASKRGHHSYPGGLIQHTLSCTKLASALCDVVEKIYGCEINRDVVTSAILLHDILKFYTYSKSGSGDGLNYANSQLGERLDHLSLAIGELYRRGFPLEVLHAVAAHHGKNSPIPPRTLEALIVHLADKVDSELSGEVIDAAKSIVRECVGQEIKMLKDGSHAFQIVLSRQIGGCSKVREVWESLKGDSDAALD